MSQARPNSDEHYASLKASPGARPIVMKWALATVALQDLMTLDRKRPPSWLDVAGAASRWVEDYGQRTGRWQGTSGAALHLSTMDAAPSAPPPPDQLGWFDRVDRMIALGMQRYGTFLLRSSLGVVFLWFGALKPLGLSPVSELVTRSIPFVSPHTLLPVLGVWEMLIGLCLLVRPLVRVALPLLFIQMLGTVLPLFLLPGVCYTRIPYGLTLEGQYIVTNLCLLSAALVVGGTVRYGLRRSEQERVTIVL